MEIEKVEEAIYEARRFIDRANLVLHGEGCKPFSGNSKYLYCGKETAACRRSSMDLTRSLAELRK